MMAYMKKPKHVAEIFEPVRCFRLSLLLSMYKIAKAVLP